MTPTSPTPQDKGGEVIENEFEAWMASSNYPEIADIALERLPGGTYKSQLTFAAWQAWQGAYNNIHSTLTSETARLRERVRVLEEALEFYANPQTYHAIAFLGDAPCGEFIEDFSEDHGDDFYERPMPGKRARSALLTTQEAGGL